MKRVLILYHRDWLNPKSGVVEYYLHEVFTRIASLGNYIVWISHSYRTSARARQAAPQMEIVDGIQIARLGFRCLHRAMVGLLLNKLAKTGKFERNFDAIIDCVDGMPISAANQAPVPVLPLIFNLYGSVQDPDRRLGPVIAASDRARRQIARTGVPENRIVRAPYGVDQRTYTPSDTSDGAPTVVVVDNSPRFVTLALNSLCRQKELSEIHVIGGTTRRSTRNCVSYHSFGDEEQRASLYRKALFGYCGEGSEPEALSFAGCGVPVICPDTPVAREYVVDGETGLLFEPGNRKALAGQLTRLTKDEVLRKRLAVHARERAKAMTWEKTASLVLATIENL